jgi:sterol desaturase/sphingolipid hydroxylase (fatty acid hydroxylase superfamily)
MASDLRNPRDSMVSTWRHWDHKEWNFGHWVLEAIRANHVDLDIEVLVFQKTDKVPYAPGWKFQCWVLLHALIPIAIQQAYVACFGRNMSPLFAFVFYSLSLKFIAIRQLHLLRHLGQRYGFFDGDVHERDGVPDVGVLRTLRSLLSVVAFRPMIGIILTYRPDLPPSSIKLAWLPIEVGLYAVVLDFWFYWYHRLMHTTGSLWKFHRTHHLTKHPNPLLTSYADSEQEFFDIVGIPLITYGTMKLLGFPMGFYEWWICSQFVIFTELLGHSGLRMEATAVSPLSWLLRIFDMELVIEDHDLHHRKGWKQSHNYGKQTRVWDRIFGTTYIRVEGTKDNIDYVNTVQIPLF